MKRNILFAFVAFAMAAVAAGCSSSSSDPVPVVIETGMTSSVLTPYFKDDVNYNKYVAELEQWVNIDTKSRDIAGMTGIAKRVMAYIQDDTRKLSQLNLMKLPSGNDPLAYAAVEKGTYSDNLTNMIETKNSSFMVVKESDGYISGIAISIKGDNPDGPRISLWPHVDAVMNSKDTNPDGTPVKWVYNSERKTAVGPGVGDSKASSVMALYIIDTLSWMKQNGQKLNFSEVRIWWDGNEEGASGSTPNRSVWVSEVTEWSDVCLHLDTGRPNYGTAVLRKGSAGTFTFTVRGVAGHATNGYSSSLVPFNQIAYIYQGIIAMAGPIPGMDKFVKKQGEKIYPGHPLHDPTIFELSREAELKQLGQGSFDRGQFLPDCQVTPSAIANAGWANVVNGAWQGTVSMSVSCYYIEQAKEFRDKLRNMEIAGTEYANIGRMLDPDKLAEIGVPVLKGAQVYLTSRGNTFLDEGGTTRWGGFNAYDNDLKPRTGSKVQLSNRDVLEQYRKIMRDDVKPEPVNPSTGEKLTLEAAEFQGISEWYAAGGTLSNTTTRTRPTLDTLAIDAHPLLEHTYRDSANLFSFEPRIKGLVVLINTISDVKHKEYQGDPIPKKDRYPYLYETFNNAFKKMMN